MARRAFIVGSTGQIGRATAAALLDGGWQVTLCSRGGQPAPLELIGRGATVVALDREEPGALAKALGDGADAVIDTIAYTEAHADQLLAIQADVGALAVISSAGVYRDAAGKTLGGGDFPDPITESQSTVEPGTETYAARKVALERRLLDHATRPVTILRPCAIHGAYSTQPREWWFVKRILDRRPVIPVAFRGRSRFQTSAAANIGALIAQALDRPGTRLLNAADPEAPSVAEIGGLIAAHMGYAGEILPIDTDSENDAIGDTPWSCPRPFRLNTDAALALGYQPVTTYEAAVGAVCDWLATTDAGDWRANFPGLAAYPCDLFDYAAEDRFFAAAGQFTR